MYLVRSGNCELEFVEPYYYSVRTYDDGHLEISNGSSNYIMVQYDEYFGWKKSFPVSYPYNYVGEKYWDYPQEKVVYVYGDSDVWEWEYIYVDGKHPTVSGSGVNLTGGTGNDYIANSGDNVTIDGGAGADSIHNYGDNVTIAGGAGNDSIRNDNDSGSDISINAGDGDDTIGNSGSQVTIDAGAGNDSIHSNLCSKVKINGGAGNDSIYNFGSDTTIDGGTGNDYIHSNLCSKVKINGGAGDDTINYSGSDSTIDGGAGSDHITWQGSKSKITGGTGDDTISNGGKNVTIDAGDGNDYIENYGCSNVTIDAGKGNDSIWNEEGDSVTIDAGAGNDYIWNNGSKSTITAGAGDDTVSNSVEKVTIDAGADADRINNSGSYVKINAGDGNDHVGNTGSKVTINAGTGNDSIFNSAASVKINTTGDNVRDFIYNDSSEVTITAGAGADSIIVKWASGSKINGGDGDNGVSLFGGGNISVTTGVGNDSIVLYGKYAGKEIYDIYIDDNDYYCTNVTINPGGGKNFVSIPGSIDNVKVVGDEKSEGVDVIFNDAYGAVIDGGAGNDYIRNTGEGAFIFGGYDGDVIQNYASHVCIYGDNAKGKSLHKVGDYIYTDKGEDVKINGGNSDDTIVAFHDVDASISGGDGNDEIEVQRMSAEDVNKIIVNGVISPLLAITSFITKVPIPTQFDEAVLSAGQVAEEVLFDGKTLSKINNAVTVGRQIINLVQLQGYVENLIDTTSTINGGKGNDTIINDGTASRVFEYASGDGDDVITNFVADSKVQAVLINKPVSTLHITKGPADEVTVDGKDVIFKVDTGSIKLVNTATKRFQVRDEKGTLTARTYDTDKSNNVYLTEYISDAKEMYFGNGGDDTIHGTEKAESIFGGDGNDDIYGFTLRDPTAGGKDYLDGGAGDDYLRAIKGHNTLIGGADNDTISISGGNNLIVYNAGDGRDIVYGFKKSDKIQIGGDTYSTIQRDKDLIIKVGSSGSVTLKNFTSPSELKIEGTQGDPVIPEGVTLKGSALKIGDSFPDKEIYASDFAEPIKTIDASKSTKGLKLVGNELNNTITGTKKNDILTGNGGINNFVHTGGKDVITDYSSSDKISFKTTISQTTIKGSNVVFKTNNGTMTVNDAKGKTINVISSSGKNYTTVMGGTTTLSDDTNYFENNSPGETIIASSKAETIKNWASNVSINAGKGNDSIENGGSQVTINTGAGNDSLTNYGSDVSINAGTGNDSLTNYGSQVSIDAGKGNNYIGSYGSNNTISAGTGNDYISTDAAHGTVFIYGGGNDTIDGFRLTNNFLVIEGYDWSVRRLQDEYYYTEDFLVTVLDGKKTVGSVLLKNSNSPDNKLNIVSSKADVKPYNLVISDNYKFDDGTYNGKDNAKLTGTDDKDFFTNFGWRNVTMLAGAGDDIIENNHGYGDFDGQVPERAYIDAGADNDDIGNSGANSTIIGGTGHDTIWNKSAAENSIVNGSAGNDSIRNTGNNATINGDKGNDYVYNNGWFASINGGDGKDTLESRGDYTTIRGGAGNDLINDRFSPKSLFDGGAGKDTINVFGQKVTVAGGTDNDKIFLNSTGNLIKYAEGDGNDTIYGFNSTDSLSISGGSYSTTASGSDVLVKVGKGKITLKDVKGNAVYINKKNVGGSSTDKKFIALTSGDDTINNDLNGVTISGGKGNDVIENDFGDKVSINAGAGNDTIWNIAREEWNTSTNSVDTLDTPDKATLVGGKGDDYIYNQVGKNVRFQYTSGDGNDTITGFNETSTLAIVGSKYSTKKSGSNVVVTVDKGKITLDGAANLGSVNIDFSKRLTVTDKTSSPVTVASDVEIIDASSRTKAAKITGNKLANFISGGAGKDTIYGASGNDSIVGNAGNDKLYGDAGKDTLVGGKGNDSLWGGAGNDALYGGDGNDTFIYKPGEGTDTIFDYAAGDMLTILKTNGKAGGSFTSSKFSGDTLTLTINGGGSVIFDNVSASDTFNINGKSYSISGTKLK